MEHIGFYDEEILIYLMSKKVRVIVTEAASPGSLAKDAFAGIG
jgi:hypothetical protein